MIEDAGWTHQKAIACGALAIVLAVDPAIWANTLAHERFHASTGGIVPVDQSTVECTFTDMFYLLLPTQATAAQRAMHRSIIER